MTRTVYSPILDQICFYGIHVNTGLPIAITFKDTRQPYTKLVMYNRLLDKHMHSKDAGLTWTPYDTFLEAVQQGVDLIL